jgi:hypothetical protein
LRQLDCETGVENRDLKTAGFALIALGLTISALTYSWTRAMNAVPLSQPIVLSPGHFQSPVFQAHATTQHVVSIDFDDSLPPDQVDCFIGMNLIPKACGNQPAILNVKWQIFSGHQTLATGSSSDRGASYSHKLIERHIGRFDARRGAKYTLEFDVLQDGTRLAPAHPLLKVAPNLNGYEGWLMLAGLAFYVGLACAAIGAVLTYRAEFGA